MFEIQSSVDKIRSTHVTQSRVKSSRQLVIQICPSLQTTKHLIQRTAAAAIKRITYGSRTHQTSRNIGKCRHIAGYRQYTASYSYTAIQVKHIQRELPIHTSISTESTQPATDTV